MSKQISKCLILLGILGVLFSQVSCTKESPQAPAGNRPPDTFITNFSVAVEPATDSTASTFVTSIFWRGADEDGEVNAYSYRVDGGTWTQIANAFVELTLEYALQTSTHEFEVKSIDNFGVEDPTPAKATVSKGYQKPLTTILKGPPNGAQTSSAVQYVVSGSDPDGLIAAILYDTDNSGTWVEVAADAETHAATISISGLAAGSHVFAFKAKDNTGQTAESAVATTVFVGAGNAPVFEQTLGPIDGGGWFVGAAATFAWRGETSHYYGTMANYSYALDDTTMNADGSYTYAGDAWLTYTDPVSVSLEMTEGQHVVYLALKDAAGSVVMQANTVSVALPTFDQGILLVNGVHWGTYGAAIETAYEDKAFFGNLNISAFWDLFSGYVPSTLPASIGTGPVGPDVLAKYSSVIWIGNGYQGDDDDWAATPIVAYLTAGGNVLFVTRYAGDYIGDEATDYLNTGSWRGAGSAKEYVPVYPGLKPMTPFLRSMSGTDVWSAYGFGTQSDADIDAWDGTTTFERGNSTLLFVHHTNAVYPSWPHSYPRGLGVWAHPNAGTADEHKGNFVALMGREYGFDHANSAFNFEFIVKNFFGEL